MSDLNEIEPLTVTVPEGFIAHVIQFLGPPNAHYITDSYANVTSYAWDNPAHTGVTVWVGEGHTNGKHHSSPYKITLTRDPYEINRLVAGIAPQ